SFIRICPVWSDPAKPSDREADYIRRPVRAKKVACHIGDRGADALLPKRRKACIEDSNASQEGSGGQGRTHIRALMRCINDAFWMRPRLVTAKAIAIHLRLLQLVQLVPNRERALTMAV